MTYRGMRGEAANYMTWHVPCSLECESVIPGFLIKVEILEVELDMRKKKEKKRIYSLL